MYLNIINNIKHDVKRKNKNLYETKNNEKEEESNLETEFFDESPVNTYYSIFYGDLTKTWINLNNK
ncbi:MAG: hypothetical protein CMP36_02785 [Rickettsiales bacterium]|nr:hypothetical protein [Rickettsiales bacterium]OUV79611.1 MAG: hypothetical protein CBC91_03470 [Rickettsiales bacterium TMED131]|tara:strand:- start:2330 stop:2527 length:198 start_codon:yes stop_codon:yes gene_type:complete